MLSEQDSWRTGGGADSSNRPWETESLRVGDPAAPRALGIVAAAAAALLALADMALLYSPDGGYGLLDSRPLAQLPRWRLLAGHYLGVLLLPAYVAGYWLVHRRLRDAGRRLSWPVFLLGSYAACLAGACHGGLALLAVIAGHGGADPEAAGRLLEQARLLTDPLHALVNGLWVLTSLWFAAAILSGRSRFPRWLAAANPLLAGLVFLVPYLAAPGFTPALLAAPASLNLGHLVFFALVTATPRQAARRQPTDGSPTATAPRGAP